MFILKHIEKNLVLSIIKLADELHRFRNAISEKYGLTSQQWLILLYLTNDPNLARSESEKSQKTVLASELADAMHTSRPNITNLVNQLLKKGFVQQIKDHKDNRKKVLEVTSKGLMVLNEIEPKRDQYTSRLFDHLSPDEMNKFGYILESCIQKINSGEVKV